MIAPLIATGVDPERLPRCERTDREIERQNHAREVDVDIGGYHSRMKAVGIETLEHRLDAHLRLARTGEVGLVADRDVFPSGSGPRRAGRTRGVSDPVLTTDIGNGLPTPATRTGAPPIAGGPEFTLETILRELRADRDSR